MTLKRARFRREDLVPYTEPHYEWCCIGCRAMLTLKFGDPRAATGMCPRCERCGGLMAPHDTVKSNRSN